MRLGCWQDRVAFVLTDVSDVVKCYAYLAGGTPHQPARTYPLLFRRLPLALADRLFALALSLARGTFDKDCVIAKPCSDSAALEELKGERHSCIQASLRQFAQVARGEPGRFFSQVRSAAASSLDAPAATLAPGSSSAVLTAPEMALDAMD